MREDCARSLLSIRNRTIDACLAVKRALVRASKSGFLTVISVLSIAGVMVSSFALCIVVSIMGGFGADLMLKDLGLDPAKVNPNGSGISLGHPVGATGAMIATKAIYELQRVNGRYALATMCIGGGQGIAAVFERA